jgi:putative ABC transport system permease protein
MGIFALFSTVGTTLNNLFDTYNVEILVVPDQQQDFAVVSQLIEENIDGIESVQPHNGLQIEIEGLDTAEGGADFGVIVNSYDPEVTVPAFLLELRDGVQLSETNDPNAIIITAGIADDLGKGVGDTLVINGAGNSREMTIVGISTFPFPNAWARWQTVADFAGYSHNGELAARDLLIRLDTDDPTTAETADVIEDINELLLANGITATYTNFPELIDEITGLITVFQVVFNVAAALIALVGALGLLTAISMSVFERQKEIGVMRSIGAGSGTIATQFLTEGILVGLISWLVGLPLALGIEYGLLTITGFGDTFPMVYPIAAAVIGLVGMLVITTVASLWPSLAATRKTVSDILRYQ